MGILNLMSRLSLRHLKHQDLSTGYDFIHRSGLPIKFYLLQLILSYQAYCYGLLDTLSIKSTPFFSNSKGSNRMLRKKSEQEEE